MGFDDWQIEGFEMQQDLQFGAAHVRWETPEATLDFEFNAFHPPYAYASDPRGCPAYCATDRIEQAGRIRGTLRLGERVIEFDATGHRDHSRSEARRVGKECVRKCRSRWSQDH